MFVVAASETFPETSGISFWPTAAIATNSVARFNGLSERRFHDRTRTSTEGTLNRKPLRFLVISLPSRRLCNARGPRGRGVPKAESGAGRGTWGPEWGPLATAPGCEFDVAAVTSPAAGAAGRGRISGGPDREQRRAEN